MLVAPQWLIAVLALDAIIIAVACFDGVVGRIMYSQCQVRLQVPKTWSQQSWHTVGVRIDNNTNRRLLLDLRLGLEEQCESQENDVQIWSDNNSHSEHTFQVRAHQRGRFTIFGIHMSLCGPLGLVRWHGRQEQDYPIQVYPNVRQLADYELLARTDRLSLIGIRTMKRGGGDTEFDQLKEFQYGDPLSAIDWRATARRESPIIRSYQPAQSQCIMLMIDCGRMMGGQIGTGSLLDATINAAILLAHVAAKQGDQVGLLAYNAKVERFLSPASGNAQVNKIVHALHDCFAEPVESRHDVAFMTLAKRCRKRSLIIHCTQVLDHVNAQQIIEHTRSLSKRHLNLSALLRDPSCFAAIEQVSESRDAFYRAGAAAHILNERQSALDTLTKHGVLTVDTEAEQLGPELISHYLRIKAQHLL